MAKHKSQRALFELLTKQRGLEKAKPDALPGVGGPPVPTPGAAEPARVEQPPPIVQRPVPRIVRREAAIIIGGVRLSWPYLVVAGVLIVCGCWLCYLLGQRLAGDGLPVTQKHPTMKEIQGIGPMPGLVRPGPKPPALGRVVPRKSDETTPAPRPGPRPLVGGRAEPGGAKKPPPVAAGPEFRVRIARLDVSKPDTIDLLRAFLAKSGIQTELETRSGFHVLYSSDYFSDKTASDALALQINKSLGAFEKETRRPTSKDAYTVQVKKE